MMRRKMTLVAVLVLTMTALMGCGGGGSDADGGETLNRAMITGDGDPLGGSRFTTKKWRILAMKANSNYTPAGVDQTCPATATLNDSSGSATIECRANSFVEFRSDGKSRQYDDTSATTEPFDDSWDFSADVLNVTTRDGGSTDFGNYKAINEGIIGGKQRLRIRTITHTLDGEAQPEDVGNELVIEEVL